MKPLERLKTEVPGLSPNGKYVIVGIDPGIVNTGIVIYGIYPNIRLISVAHTAIVGCDVQDIQTYLKQYAMDGPLPWTYLFVEAYRPRSHFDTDARMGAAVNDIKRMGTNIYALDNTGVKNVVSRALLELLNSWNFTTKSNHQDIRSAARIAILGMLKNETLNRLLAQIVFSEINDDHKWDVY